MKINNILLVYKKSIYEIYFKDQRKNLSKQQFSEAAMAAFKESDKVHKEALESIVNCLKKYNIKYHKIYRARKINPLNVDLVIAVGGDGTLLEAARYLYKQHLIGVNSDPDRSSGHFCCSTADNFEDYLNAILEDRHQSQKINRLSIRLIWYW